MQPVHKRKWDAHTSAVPATCSKRAACSWCWCRWFQDITILWNHKDWCKVHNGQGQKLGLFCLLLKPQVIYKELKPSETFCVYGGVEKITGSTKLLAVKGIFLKYIHMKYIQYMKEFCALIIIILKKFFTWCDRKKTKLICFKQCSPHHGIQQHAACWCPYLVEAFQDL